MLGFRCAKRINFLERKLPMSLMISTKSFGGDARTAARARQMLVLANRVLANEGVVDAYGHVSIRNPEHPDTFFISRAISPEFVTESDILELDMEGEVVTPDTGMKPFGERVIHSSIYQVRPDVQAICHAHPHEIIPFTACDIPLRSVYHSNCTFYEGIPVYRALEPSSGLHIATREEGQRMAAVLAEKRGVLIRNHGVVVVGESLPRVIYSSITLRDGAKILLDTLALGVEPHYIGTEEARCCTEIQFGEVGLARGWNYWCTKAKQAFPDISGIPHTSE